MNIFLALVISVFIVAPSIAADHDFTRLPLTPTGWTDFEAMVDAGTYNTARVVFVDDVGGTDSTNYDSIANITFDSNGMFQPTGTIHPHLTIASAYAQIRTGYPDILLLKRGGNWSAGLGEYLKSGVSKTARHIIASYGTGARPILTDVMMSGRDADFTIVSGIHFYSANWLTSGASIDVRGAANDQLYEDILSENKAKNIIQGQGGFTTFVEDIAFRRCIWIGGDGRDGQLYAQQVTGILVEECVFREPFNIEYSDESRFGRSVYFCSEATDGSSYHDYLNEVDFRGNIFYNIDRGTDVRSGGYFTNNLILANDTLVLGGFGGSAGTIQTLYATNNVLMESAPHSTAGSNTMKIINIDGGYISNNIWTDATNAVVNQPSMILQGDDADLKIARNITISGNIVHNVDVSGEKYAFTTDPGLTDVQNITITGNNFTRSFANPVISHKTWGGGTRRFEGYTYSGNNYYNPGAQSTWFYGYASLAAWVTASGETGATGIQQTYPDATRNVKTYNQSLGGTASNDEFMDEVVLQSRQNWRPAYTADAVNDYIRAGFGLSEYPYGGNAAMNGSGNIPLSGAGSMTLQ